MDKRIAKRLLSLVLALEMFCSPLAMARAADPAQVRLETPMGEEVMERVPAISGGEAPAVPDAPAQARPGLDDTADAASGEESGGTGIGTDPTVEEDHGGASASSGGISAGVKNETSKTASHAELLDSYDHTASIYRAAMSFGIPMKYFGVELLPVRYGGYYKPEVANTYKAWGYRVNSGNQFKQMVRGGDNWYITLPDAGRLPDLELEGFYIMEYKPSAVWYDENNDANEDYTQLLTWTYGDSWENPAKLIPTELEPQDVGLTSEEDQDLHVRGSYACVAEISDEELRRASGVYGCVSVEDVLYDESGFPVMDPDTWTEVMQTTNYYSVPVVGRWTPSSHDELTALRVITQVEHGLGNSVTQETMPSVYTQNPRTVAAPSTLTLADITAETFADPDTPREFWIRVGEEQETLSFEFEAFEPYYDYNVGGAGDSPVSVEVTFNGAPVPGLDGQAISATSGWLTETGAFGPGATAAPIDNRTTNGVANPARSHWRVSNVPLRKVSEAQDVENDPFTTITITITAPNGVDKSVYTIHVERQMRAVYTLGYGNTPVALIEKDVRGNWGNNAVAIRAAKDAAITNFKEHHYLGNNGVTGPGDSVYYKGYFNTNAWQGLRWEGQTWPGLTYYNIDLDPTAVVAYQDMAFSDPGISLTGSSGQKVIFGAGATGDYKNCVTRTIRLKTADKLTVDLYGGAGSQSCWYTTDNSGRGKLSATEVSQILQNADGSDVVDLRGLNVLPGIYTIVYTFTDPLAPGDPLEVKRPLVVLPTPGDVDMDGAVTLADALTLNANQAKWDASNASDVKLLRNRVWGNGIDATKLLEGFHPESFQPILADRGNTDYYYPPLPAPLDTYSRKTWDQVELNGKAKLELRYLGLEQGILQGEELYTTPVDGHMGPWTADAAGKVSIRETNSYGHYQPDVFWVGVYLTAGDLAGSAVEDLTLSLVYDSDYVAPAVVYPYNNALFDGDNDQSERWKTAIFYYNMNEGSRLNGAGQTLFSGMTGSDYGYKAASNWGRSYDTHYSKVIGELENIQGANLREMVVCFQGGSASTSRRVQLRDGYLLVMPFQLIKHPSASRLQNGEARLVELSAGMRDFNMVAKAPAGTAQGLSVASLLGRAFSAATQDNAIATLADSAGVATYAFSAQDSIYGGATQNIREGLGTVSSAAIPIGENKTETIVLAEGKYAEHYEAHLNLQGVHVTGGKLPDGLQYNSAQSILSGTPMEAGTFQFTLSRDGNSEVEYYYTLVVRKRPLRFNVESAGSYYGQNEYRGVASGDFTFVYRVEDLAPEDRPLGAASTGARPGAELADILGSDYVAPQFTARLSTDTLAAPVVINTHVGSYPIVLENEPLDDKYELVLSSERRELSISRRPVRVDYVEVDFDALRKEGYEGFAQGTAQIYSDGDDRRQVMTLTETDEAHIMIHLTAPTLINGLSGNRPWSGEARVEGDLLTLQFSGEVQRLQRDEERYPDNRTMFEMLQGSESRPISSINAIALLNTGDYELLPAQEGTQSPEKNNVTGTVIRREITELVMAAYPIGMTANTSITYGSNLSLSGLRMKIFRNGQQVGDLPYDFTYDYDGTVAMAMDIHYNWVTKEEMKAGLASPNTVVGSGWDPSKPEGEQDTRPYEQTNDGMLTCELDGYYLCAIARKFETSDPAGQLGENGYVKCYSAAPISVRKRTITLTLRSLNRFYGETGAAAEYTFRTADLATADARALYEKYPGPFAEGTGSMLEDAELKDVFGFTAPTIEFMKRPRMPTGPNDPDIVTVSTDVPTTSYYVVMGGAAATNYEFRYARVDGERLPSTEFGTSWLTIWQRPVVVKSILSADASDPTANFATIYADSKALLLTQQVDGATKTAFEAGQGQVTFIGPSYDSELERVDFYNPKDSTPRYQSGAVYSGDAVLPQDLSQLGVRYNVQFIPDQDHASWYSTAQNYFSVTELEHDGGQGQRGVELRDMELTGAKARNYRLVYRDDFRAMQCAPDDSVQVRAPRTGLPAGSAELIAYAQYGTGLVILRPIESMELVNVGRMEYHYGEAFSPGMVSYDQKGFVLEVRYATRYENNPEQYAGDTHHNISKETVEYRSEMDSDTFTRRGFTFHYIDAPNGPGAVTDAQKAAVVTAGQQTLQGEGRLYPAIHNGKYLFVSGRRGDNDPTVYSVITSMPLVVTPGQITLTARDIHRFYGEDNATGYVIQERFDPTDDVPPFTYTFSAGQLANWDREKIASLLGKTLTINDTLTQADLAGALDLAAQSSQSEDRDWARDFGYVAPSFDTPAKADSPINTDHGQWGEYPVNMTVRDFSGYQVTGEPGTLYVYPRPIRITGIASTQEDPVYTIYNHTTGTIFNTSFSQDRVSVERGNNIPGLTTWIQALATQNRSAQLPLTGSALVGSDELIYKAQIQYLGNTTLGDGITNATMRVVATIPANGLMNSADDAQRNYALTGSFEEDQAWGAVKLRTIDYILVETLPKLNYTYGDTLDLTGLKVQVVYKGVAAEGAIVERVPVTYMDANQFQSYGLYVNYWDMDKDTLSSDEGDRKAMPVTYRTAATGDHLTIAPTHDTQQYLGTTSNDPLRRPFAANGMSLVISAFQDGLNQVPAQPKILAASKVAVEGTGLSSYEVTDANPYAAKIRVAPLRLQYTASATDKTYDGDTKTAGTVRLTNVFDRTGVQTRLSSGPNGQGGILQTAQTETVTDVVYLPVGARYEGRGDDYSPYAANGYRVSNGAIAFTTGQYTNTTTSLMDKNDAVAWAQGYRWDAGMLEFTFTNPNVHYEDASFASGLPGVGTAALAQYWRANQALEREHDTYPQISQMPVEIRNMTLLGPDAANYTWGPSDAAQRLRTELTLDTDPATLAPQQGNLPYATIHKANRQSIQELLGSGYTLPQLTVDEHTNVVRLTYPQDLAALKDMTAAAQGSEGVHNAAGTEDYRSELHFEYALAYQDETGMLRQWAGRTGAQLYQDTRFFGGEVCLPVLDEGYAPDLTRLDDPERADEKTVYKGQRYRWAGEDTGVAENGYREDSGFYIDPTAYPGYATYGESVREAYWQYDLYNTDRAALPRDTVFYPLVRLAETHNYNPSPDLTGDADGDAQEDVSAQSLYDARVAVAASDSAQNAGGEPAGTDAQALLDRALLSSKVVLDQAVAMAQAARKQAQEQVEADALIAEDRFPETPPESSGPISAVKTYRLRLDMLTAAWERNQGASGSGDQEYLIRMVEAVEFTDTMSYPDEKLMDAVVYNNPQRYYTYAWDPDRSAQLKFNDEENPVDFGRLMTFAIRQRQEGGETVETTWVYDPVSSNYTAQIYVTTSPSGGRGPVRKLQIVPRVLYARLGDAPLQLGLITEPERPTNRNYTWTSSDPSVVSVSASGLVTFRGEGTAQISVASTNGLVDTITVIVSPALDAAKVPGSLFNFFYQGPWATLDGSYAFRPQEPMTRAQVVELLDLFLDPDREWGATQEVAYIDITRKERYYGALARLTNVGVVKGLPGSAFAGERLATRAEFVTMLARMLKLDTPDTIGMAHAFADSGEDSTWAYAYIDAMAKAGVIQGVGGGSFAPSRAITREEAAVILSRLLTVKLDTTQADLITPSDMTPENWSYPSVLRAINTVLFPD